MFRRLPVALAILVPILAIGAGVALLDLAKGNRAPGNDGLALTSAGGTSLSGQWQLDRSKSDFPRRGGRGPGGGWGRRDGDGPRDGDRGRRGRLPGTIRIEQTKDKVEILDESGTPLQWIVTGANQTPDNSVPVFTGAWKGNALEIVRDGRRGKTIQQFSLEEKGATLVIRTTMESDGDRPAREFKRVYRRTGT